MKHIAIIYLFYFLRACSCGDNKTPNSQDKAGIQTTPCTLDLSKKDNSNIGFVSKDDSGIKHCEYTPKSGNHISSVTDGKLSVWTAPGGEKSLHVASYSRGSSKLVTVDVKSDHETTSKHFESKGGKSTSLSTDQLKEKLDAMKADAAKDYKLDLANANLEKVLVDKTEDGELSHIMYHPNGYTSVVSVMDGSNVVWEAGPGEKLLHARGYSVKNSSCILHLRIVGSGKETHKYFEKSKDKWSSTDDKGFKSKHEEMRPLKQGETEDKKAKKNRVDAAKKKPVDVVDVEKPDEFICKTLKCRIDGVETVLCSPFWGLKEVKCGSTSIWQAKNKTDEKCVLLKIHSKDNGPVMVHLTNESNSKLSEKAFQKDGSKWNDVSDYNAEVKKLALDPRSNNDFTLDLQSEVNTDQYNVFKTSALGMPMVLFVPNSGHHAKKLTCGTRVLYEPNKDENKRIYYACISRYSSSLSLVYFAVVDLASTTEYYCINEGNLAYTLDRAEYLDLLQKMENRQVSYKYLAHSLSSPDSGCKTVDSSVGDIPAKLLIPPTGTCLKRITDGDKIVWGSGGYGDACALGILYLKGGNSSLLHVLKINGGGIEERFYVKGGNGWEECRDPTKKIKDLKTSGNSLNFELNLCSQKDDNVQVVDMSTSIFPMTLFVPKVNCVATSVKYGEEELIKKVGKDRVVFAAVYFNDGDPFLLHILLRDSSSKPKPKYYERKNDKWKSINKNNFDPKIGTMSV